MIFSYAFNETRQTLSDVILQQGDGVAVIPTLAKKITSELADVWACWGKDGCARRLSAHKQTRHYIAWKANLDSII